jgi:hypothetical protein
LGEKFGVGRGRAIELLYGFTVFTAWLKLEIVTVLRYERNCFRFFFFFFLIVFVGFRLVIIICLYVNRRELTIIMIIFFRKK